MTQQFHEGQEVEVLKTVVPSPYGNWRKAKIVRDRVKSGHAADGYEVQFPDGTRAVFDAEHIRAVTKFREVPGTCIQQHDWYQE